MKKLCLIPALLFFSLFSYGQLIIETNISDDQFLNWVGGPGVNVTNLAIECDGESYGTFYNPSIDNGLDVVDGLLLTTGTAINSVGPNNSFSISGYPSASIEGDADLELSVPGFVFNDVCRIEFDLVPSFDNIIFNFVFGSDEYLEFVNSSYNDAFGFFISGPGIDGPYTDGADNFSMVPGTDLAVAIDNVNDMVNSDYYVNNGDGSSLPFSTDSIYCQYDGLTSNIEGNTPVTGGETYHIKIVIADAGDSAFDSGVFLQKDCFKSIQDAVGIQELEDLDIQLFPNPTAELLNLQGGDLSSINGYEIVSVHGKIIESGQLLNDNRQIDVSALSKGTYILNLLENGQLTTVMHWMKK